ncbi:MAG TPA: hypothetical protein PKV72_00310 [Candidatus Peribacteria bacterium]|nr:hypothetical protein [Candidatus Peribacteria bacterium]
MQTLAREPQALAAGQYDLALALPAYNEGRGILAMLHTMATQEDISDTTRMLVAVVVNQAKDAPADVTAGNALTHELVASLWSGIPPEGLEKDEAISVFPESNMPWFNAVVEAMQVRRRIEVILVDMYTEAHAPDRCNVGIARGAGCETVIPLLKPDGILMTSDADSWAKPNLAAQLFTAYADPAVMAVTGTVTHMPTHETVNIDRMRDAEAYLRSAQIMTYRILRSLPHAPADDREHDAMMPGAFMTMRPEVYAAAGGFDDAPGAEDTALSLRILRLGHKIHRRPEAEIFTLSRVSLRTHEDNGLGQAIARKMPYSETPNEYPVRPMRAVAFIEELNAHLERSRTAAGEAAWRESMRSFRAGGLEEGDPQSQLSETELDRLWNEFQRAPAISHVSANGFIWLAVSDMGKARYADIRMDMALHEVQAALENHEEQEGCDQVTRFNGLIREDNDVLATLAAFAKRRIEQETAADQRRGRIARVMFGFPVNEVDAAIQHVEIWSRRLQTAAAVQYSCEAAGTFAFAMFQAATTHRDAMREAGVVPETLLSITGSCGAAMEEIHIIAGAGWNLLERSRRFGTGMDEADQMALREGIRERLTAYADALDKNLATARRMLTMLATGVTTLLDAVADAHELLEHINRLSAELDAGQTASSRWRRLLDA